TLRSPPTRLDHPAATSPRTGSLACPASGPRAPRNEAPSRSPAETREGEPGPAPPPASRGATPARSRNPGDDQRRSTPPGRPPPRRTLLDFRYEKPPARSAGTREGYRRSGPLSPSLRRTRATRISPRAGGPCPDPCACDSGLRPPNRRTSSRCRPARRTPAAPRSSRWVRPEPVPPTASTSAPSRGHPIEVRRASGPARGYRVYAPGRPGDVRLQGVEHAGHRGLPSIEAIQHRKRDEIDGRHVELVQAKQQHVVIRERKHVRPRGEHDPTAKSSLIRDDPPQWRVVTDRLEAPCPDRAARPRQELPERRANVGLKGPIEQKISGGRGRRPFRDEPRTGPLPQIRELVRCDRPVGRRKADPGWFRRRRCAIDGSYEDLVGLAGGQENARPLQIDEDRRAGPERVAPDEARLDLPNRRRARPHEDRVHGSG